MDDKNIARLKNVMPNTWQEEMRRQRFNCIAKGQAKCISFCKKFKFLDPLKDKKSQKDNATTSSTANNN
eukprot:14322896-Ditylum_brightwellii.AAC.1